MALMHWEHGEKAVKSVKALWKNNVDKIHSMAFLRREKEERKNRSLVVSPPSFPEIPQPKERPKDRYTVLVLPESGDAKQLALSKSRLKIIAAFSATALVILLILAVGIVKYFSRHQIASVSKPMPITQAVVPANDSGSTKEQPTASTSKLDDSVVATKPTSVPVKDNRPTASTRSEEHTTTAKIGDQKVFQENTKDQPNQVSAADNSSASRNKSDSQGVTASEASPEPFLINFDAQQVTATVEAPNSGTLSFRLVKDQPDIKFAGYLFVYVEMEDKRGENRIYVYPKETRLGEGDLPYDFRDGETIAFKFNSRVELPYGDPRPAAYLSGVSILLYGENGKIVFQRTFGRQEVALITPKSNKAEQIKPRSSEKRQAL